MSLSRRRTGLALAALAALVATVAVLAGRAAPPAANAASHREAPLISMDPGADITDFFLFRSYETGKSDRAVLVMDVMSEEPSSGPNYWNFDPNVEYSFGIDNDRDGVADDVRFDFRFTTELRGLTTQLGLPLSYVGGGPLPVIDDLDDAGIGLRQTYNVSMSIDGKQPTTLAAGKIAVPSNVGPRTMPNYDALAAQGDYTLDGGIRVFAGQRDDPFFIDLGAVFDTLNLRTFFGPPPSLGVDMLGGFNVHTIALEVPISLLAPGQNKVIGAYAFTSRPQVTVRGEETSRGKFVQVQRLANPLVNEVVIGTQDKDRWNATEPEDESRFLGYYLKPRFAAALQLVFGLNTGCLIALPGCAPSPPAAGTLPGLAEFNRNDLQALLLQYNPILYGAGPAGAVSDLLRVDLNTRATPLGSQSSVPAALGGDDPAAWPNGRRPNDDVTDIAVKAVGGPNYLPLATIDGVNANDRPTTAAFPFLATPHDGRNRVHPNP